MRKGTAILFLIFLASAGGFAGTEDKEPESSPFFAYVGRDFIFTIEVVEPGTPLLNFVSITDREEKLQAKDIRLSMGNRQVNATLFFIEADRYQDPLAVSSIRMNPRSSFGFRLEANLQKATELFGVEITVGNAKFELAALTKFDFETLVRKVNRINLGSPDFRDDYRVLDIELLGKRSTSLP
jgi:hypothetical protein